MNLIIILKKTLKNYFILKINSLKKILIYNLRVIYIVLLKKSTPFQEFIKSYYKFETF